MFLVDSHCHLDLLNLSSSDDLLKILMRANDAGVKHILNVCVKISEFDTILKTALSFPFVSASLGLHPNERDEEVSLETLLQLGAHPKVVGIGETGLDYFRSTGDLDWQRERFCIHIAAAKQLKKPLIVHTRAAKEDTMIILKNEFANECGGVMHCFSEDWAIAKQALDLGFYISFSGTVTFKNTPHLQEVASKMPLDRMLIETDAPYLAPAPHRGKQNEPAFVQHTAKHIADLRQISLESIAHQTSQNFFSLFKGANANHV
jgi:TatD DNase family protein